MISGQSGQQFRILASEEMSDWTTIGEMTLGENGSSEFTDPVGNNFKSRFYILKSP